MRLLSLIALTIPLLTAHVGPLLAADGAQGNFHFGKLQFKPTDSMAYQIDDVEPGKTITVVALTDFPIDRAAAIAAIDTTSSLLTQINDNQKGNLIVVRFRVPKQCGIFAFLGESSQQIDLGDSFTAGGKGVGAGRVEGDCATSKSGKMFDDEYDFHVSYDLPITVIPKALDLPAGGGEPGKALVAAVKAIQAGDWNTAKLHIGEQELAAAPKPSEIADFFESLKLNWPKSAVVTGGKIKGNLALLDMTGRNREDRKIKGLFSMKKVGPNWRVVEQNLFFDE